MNAKLTVDSLQSEFFKKACELADVKILDSLMLDKDIKYIVRFRDPVKLFQAGIYFCRLQAGLLKIQTANESKRKR